MRVICLPRAPPACLRPLIRRSVPAGSRPSASASERGSAKAEACVAPPAPPNEDIVPLHSLHSIPLSSFLHAPHDDDDDDGPDCVSSAHPVALYEKKLKKENRADADFSAECEGGNSLVPHKMIHRKVEEDCRFWWILFTHSNFGGFLTWCTCRQNFTISIGLESLQHLEAPNFSFLLFLFCTPAGPSTPMH